MSRRQDQRRAEMFRAEWLYIYPWNSGTDDEEAAFERYGLSEDARRVARYSACLCSVSAAACYAAIARSLVKR